MSLRQAMTLANADPGSTITFHSGLTGTLTLGSPLPEITADMSIGAPNWIEIERDAGAPAFRIFTITGAVEFELSDIVVKGGDADAGGALRVPAGATANLYQVTIWNNRANGAGGGIHNEGTTTLENSVVYQNYASSGGGIFNNGTLYVQFNSIITANSALVAGGGILNSEDRTCVVSDSAITWNTAAFAAFALGIGGGVFNDGNLQISNTLIENNAAFLSGGGIYCSGGSTTTLTSVTISTNHASNVGGSGRGGGFFLEGSATLSAASCSLSGNTADAANSGGGYVMAGGNFLWSGTPYVDPVFFEDPV
jgi:hypothetical protein